MIDQMFLVLFVLNTLFVVLFGEDCTEPECQFQYYQKIGYDSSGCFEDIEAFTVNHESYIAYCENVDSTEAVRILKQNNETKKWESFQKLAFSSDDDNCDDIAFFQDESNDEKNFLFICGSSTNIYHFKWENDEFDSQPTIIQKDFDTLGSCSVEKIYTDSNYKYYFVENAFIVDDFQTQILFYPYDDDDQEFPLSSAYFASIDYNQLGRLSFTSIDAKTYMFAPTYEVWDTSNPSLTPYTSNSSLWELKSSDGSSITLNQIGKYPTQGSTSVTWIDTTNTNTNYDNSPLTNENSMFFGVTNQQSTYSLNDIDVSIGYFNKTMIDNADNGDLINGIFYQSIETKNALVVLNFVVNSKLYLGIGESQDSKSGSSQGLFAIYEYDNDINYFIPFQTIVIKESVEIAWASVLETSDNEVYLALGPCYNDDATESGVYIYSWDDVRQTTVAPDTAATLSKMNAIILGFCACILALFV